MESCQVIALCLHRPDVILFRYTCMYYLLSLYVWTLWEWTIPCSDLHHWSYKICAFVNVFIEYVNMYRLIKNVFSFRIMWLMKCCQEWLTCCGLSISLFLYLHHNNKYFYRHTSMTSHWLYECICAVVFNKNYLLNVPIDFMKHAIIFIYQINRHIICAIFMQ